MRQILLSFLAFILFPIQIYAAEEQMQESFCTALDQSTFLSVDELAGGLTPEGVDKMNWSIKFKEGVAQWDYEDMSQSGTYECSDNTVKVKLHDREIEATYDSEEKILLWDEVKYKRSEENYVH